jgi:hypothetical protein
MEFRLLGLQSEFLEEAWHLSLEASWETRIRPQLGIGDPVTVPLLKALSWHLLS